jgi:hypothetical protein
VAREPVLSLGRFDRIAHDDRRREDDARPDQPGDAEPYPYGGEPEGKAGDEGDDGNGEEQVAGPQSEVGEGREPGPTGEDRVGFRLFACCLPGRSPGRRYPYHRSQPARANSAASFSGSRSRAKYLDAMPPLWSSRSGSGDASHSPSGAGSEASNQRKPQPANSVATG